MSLDTNRLRLECDVTLAGASARVRLGDFEGACMRRNAAFGAGYCAALAAAHTAVRSLATEADGAAEPPELVSEGGRGTHRSVEDGAPEANKA